MATEGSSDSPKLVDILKLPAVVKTNNWKEVGLELGIEKCELDRIDIDCQRQTNDCKREMFDIWLKKDLHKSLEDVTAAVKKANERLEGAHIRDWKCIRNEGNIAINAIKQVKESLERMDDMNRDIVRNQYELEEKLEEQKRNWKSFQIQCTEEDKKRNEGEQRRQQIKETLEARNIQESQFVKRFLREKGLSDNLSDEEVKCYLRNELLAKETARSKQIRSRHQKAQKYHKELKHLVHETRKWEELVEERATQVYPKIVASLKELGVKEETFQALEQQLKKLKNTLEECRKAVEDFDQVLREGENDLQKCEEQLREFSESFSEAVKGTEEFLKWLEDSLGQIEKRAEDMLRGSLAGGLVGAMTAAGAGAAVGSATLPVVGTLIGAGIGAVVGVVSGMNDDKKSRSEIEDRKRRLQKCKDTEEQAKYELEKLRKMLQSKI